MAGKTVIDRLFRDHPRSVGEGYGEHARIAARFGWAMVSSGTKCLIHAIIPAFFPRAASDRVGALHAELAERRRRAGDTYPEYVI